MNVSLADARRLLGKEASEKLLAGGPKKPPKSALEREQAALRRERFERHLASQFKRRLIPFMPQAKFYPGRKWRADFWVLGTPPVLVEVDGGTYLTQSHHGRGGYEADRERDAAALSLGFLVLRVTPRQVTSGEALGWLLAIRKRWGSA